MYSAAHDLVELLTWSAAGVILCSCELAHLPPYDLSSSTVLPDSWKHCSIRCRERHYAALVCHPHPLFGGTLHNKVVFHAMKALNSFGFPVLRFNFRGTGLSQGEHDHGRGEMDDVRAALDWLERNIHLPIVFAGFSFGAAVGLRACAPMSACRP